MSNRKKKTFVLEFVPAHELENELNSIKEGLTYTYRGLVAEIGSELVDFKVNPDGTFTVVYEAYSTAYIREQIDRIKVLRKHADELIENTSKRADERIKARDDERKRIKQQVEDEWNSRSAWYRFWHDKPDYRHRLTYTYWSNSYSRDDYQFNLIAREAEAITRELRLKNV